MLLLSLMLATLPPDHSDDIPAFARRYRVSCNLCHNPAPRLTGFGEMFAANGFRMVAGEVPPDTVDTGESTLTLMRELPLAIRMDSYMRAYSNGSFATDFEMPYNVKILSGGPLSGSLSYYFYFFLFERGEVGGIEDAFIYANDLFGQPIDLAIGQFQVSDPLFKRELRLPVEDYAIYRARMGAQPADLTYDRGVMAALDAAEFTITAIAVNGNGRGAALDNRHFDDNAPKNFMGHITRNVLPGVRLGALGYFGRQSGQTPGGTITNELWMVGGDATLAWRDFELNVQYLHREDDAPTFTPLEETASLDGGFAELIWAPARSRWYAIGLYNLIDTDRPLLDVRLGGPGNVDRYESVTGGLGYRLRQNFRVYGESTWDIELEEGRWTLGLTAAF